MLQVFKRRPISNVAAGILPLLYLLAVIVFDHYMPGPPVTPPLCTLALLFMALILPTPWMIFWTVVYSALVLAIFHLPGLYYFTAHTYDRPLQVVLDVRAFSFFCVGIFSATFSYLLNKHRTSLMEMYEIVAKFPDPIVISDFSGSIINCNNKTIEKLGINKRVLVGLSYFDYFSPPELKGSTIAKYLSIFDGNTKRSELKLCIGNYDYVGDTMILESSGRKLLLTVFKEPKFKNNESLLTQAD